MSLSEYSLEKSVMLIMARWVGFFVSWKNYVIEEILSFIIVLVDSEEFERGLSSDDLELVVDLSPFEGFKVQFGSLDFRHILLEGWYFDDNTLAIKFIVKIYVFIW